MQIKFKWSLSVSQVEPGNLLRQDHTRGRAVVQNIITVVMQSKAQATGS